MNKIKNYVDPVLALLCAVSFLLFFGQACATQGHVSHYEITGGKPTYVMGDWYQCKQVEVK